MILLALLVALPCHLWDSGEHPLGPGIWGFQVRNAYVDWCHAPMETTAVTLDVTVRSVAPGCMTFYPTSVQDHDRGPIGLGPGDEPTFCWRRRVLKRRVDVTLGLPWMPLDLGLLIEARRPVHLSMDLVGAR